MEIGNQNAFEIVKSVAERFGIIDKVKVVMVLDAFAEMEKAFRIGLVDKFIQSIFSIGSELGIEPKVEQWWFARAARRFTPLTVENYQTPPSWETGTVAMGIEAFEPFILQELIDEYDDSNCPVLILFISGGCPTNYGKENKIREFIYTSAVYPIFWQFINLEIRQRDDGYDTLKHFHEIPNRYVENTGIISMWEASEIDLEPFYVAVFRNFADWLTKAREKNLVGNTRKSVTGYPTYDEAVAKQVNKDVFGSSFLGKLKDWLTK